MRITREQYPFADRFQPRVGDPTPWGPVQDVSTVAEGIWCIDTAGHGGYLLSPDRDAEVAKRFPGFKPFAGRPWYEEDCDWAPVVVTFPDLFPPEALLQAKLTIEGNPYYEGKGWKERAPAQAL